MYPCKITILECLLGGETTGKGAKRPGTSHISSRLDPIIKIHTYVT